MKKLVKYLEFINESSEYKGYSIPSYEEAVELCSKDDAPFYESKMVVDGFNVSVFNYRLAQYKDFANPLEHKPELKGYEMRGLTFVFNEDGSFLQFFLTLINTSKNIFLPKNFSRSCLAFVATLFKEDPLWPIKIPF